MRKSFSQTGNILFILLVAIILMAALVYAVNNSLRGTGKDGSSEKYDLIAAQAIQYTSLVENTVQRAMIVNNVPEYGFNMSGPYSEQSQNFTCSNPQCTLYTRINGSEGLIASQRLPDAAYVSGASGSDKNITTNISKVVGIGTDKEDVIMYYGYLKQQVCEAINAKLGLNVDLSVSDAFGGTVTSYQGTLTSIPVTNSSIGDASTGIQGRPAGCYKHPSVGYVFYQVLITR